MNPSKIFIERPVGTILFMIAILFAGALGFRNLPLSALPEVDYPTIEVSTFYPGASPDVMSTSVTAPLETQFGQMAGLNQMTSQSSGGASIITLQFSLSVDIDVAEQEVQAAINAGGNLLPSDLPAPPIYAKVNPADAPILTLALTSNSLPLTSVEDLAETRIAEKISQLDGVGLVSIGGGLRPSVRIRFKPQALAADGLNIDDLRTIISNNNVNGAKGSFDGPAQATSINANDQLTSAGQYDDMVLAYVHGAPVRLKDVADIVSAPENSFVAAWANKKPAIILSIQRQPGANVISVVKNVQALLPKIEATLPPSVNIQVMNDRTTTIRASVSDVEFELMLSVALVVLVLFLFLRSVPATIIPSLSVPLSLVGTFGVMYLAGFSLDNLSLMALTIATGFVVDDAIVMIENISRFIEEGDKPLDAAFKGAKQIGFTIISLTVSLIAVLIPLLFMGEVVGRLFHEFAITLAVTIIISAVVSLTLVPMMCGRVLRHREAKDRSRFDVSLENWFSWIIARYDTALNWVLDRQPATLVVAAATLVLTVLLYIYIPKGFFPVQDTGMITGISEANQGISFQAMSTAQQRLADEILKDQDVVSVTSSVGIDGTNVTLNSGRLDISLKPRDQRDLSASQIITRLQSEVSSVPGIQLFMQPVQDLTIDSTVSRNQYQFVLENADSTQFNEWVPKLLTKLRALPQLSDVASDLEQKAPLVMLVIDRATAARFGITPATIDNALYDSFGQRIVSTIYTQSNQYRVIMEADPKLQESFAGLNKIYLPTSASASGEVPLSAIVSVQITNGPAEISHYAQFPSTTVSFNLANGVSLGQAVDAVKKVQSDLNLPASFVVAFQGAAASFQSSLGNEVFLLLAAVATMYIVLGVLYESFIHPVTILSTLPSATVGALIALMIAGDDLDVIAIIGIVLLIGIVKKNAIMMIDFALQAERDEGKPPRQAIHQACLLRFRPILMTTMAAILGALPLMLGSGTGAELRRPLGVAIVGGLILSQILTLFTTPVIYLAFDNLALRFRRPEPEPTPRLAE